MTKIDNFESPNLIKSILPWHLSCIIVLREPIMDHNTRSEVMNQVIKKPKTEKEMIAAIRKEAEVNRVFNEVCHLFASRKRTRRQVVLTTLKNTMAKEGHVFSREQYEGVLLFLGNLGIGTIHVNSKKRVTALKDIKVTLQSIGKVALTKKAILDKKEEASKFKSLRAPSDTSTKEFVESVVAHRPPSVPVVEDIRYPSYLTVLIDGKPVNFSGPTDLTADNLADFLTLFKRSGLRDKDN